MLNKKGNIFKWFDHKNIYRWDNSFLKYCFAGPEQNEFNHIRSKIIKTKYLMQLCFLCYIVLSITVVAGLPPYLSRPVHLYSVQHCSRLTQAGKGFFYCIIQYSRRFRF